MPAEASRPLAIHPLTPERWPDLLRLFGPRGACAGCWCTWWKLGRKEFDAGRGGRNRRRLETYVEHGHVPGLLAYDGEEAVGWIAIEPREAYPRLARSRVLAPVDERPVWSITCFFVARPHRGKGITRALIEDGLPGANIAQVGLAPFANSRQMHQDALTAGNLVIAIGEVRQEGIDRAVGRALTHVAHCKALVIDCDIDVIDRSQFPAAPGARPGGMAVDDFFHAVRRLAADRRVRLIDLTEWDPPLDPSDLSALTAARWLAECLAGFESR